MKKENFKAEIIFNMKCGVKAWHAAQRNISTLPKLSECTISVLIPHDSFLMIGP